MNILKISDILEQVILPGRDGDKVKSWINVKIDNDLSLRISRYTRSIDTFSKMTGLKEKLELLSNPKLEGDEYGIQCKLSIILLLQYLKELKSNFSPSSSGFLFEGYIAGLLHLKYKDEDYGPIDIQDKNVKYQIKFYKYNPSGQITRLKRKNKDGVKEIVCDKYVVGLKFNQKIDIYILEKNEIIQLIGDGESIQQKFIINDFTPQTLDLKNIDKNISKISADLQDFINKMYDNISELNYNIETIITGVSKDNKEISINDIDKYYDLSSNNLKQIEIELKGVRDNISNNLTKYK